VQCGNTAKWKHFARGNHNATHLLSWKIHKKRFVKMDPDEYRAKAAACRLVAESSKDPNIRTRWLAMAQAWNRVADEAERIAIHAVLSRDRHAA
jgi:hypothetical protein